ncbi:carbohydrate ABC transporter permease [Caldalkalibacillus salinus]|uniref:carbohydrate ABC transporter permease n=1 Tax=Caldalkalibacillus salinus TaxID=2803787 RepID=UPI0019209135|nr:carbohydrate ABC transporter permease [Caldalkalibacillus salinus]
MMRTLLFYVLLIISAFLLFFPVLFAILASFLSSAALHSGDYIPKNISFENYVQAFTSVPLLKFLMNSFIVSFSVMVGQLILCSLAAYALVFIPFKGRHFFFFLILSTMLVPWEATMIPNYITVLNLGWLNTYQGLTVPFFAIAFGIFLLRQHFLTIPRELHESAQMDGCSRFRFFASFVIPLSRPVLIALGIYGFLTTWNMYLWPLLATSNENVRTVQIGIKMMIAQEASTSWNMVMAGVVIILLPTLLLLFFGLNYLKRGLMSGALKG